MEKVRTPKVKILYNKKDISKDISKTLLSVNYSDAEEGETDDLSLELEDVGGLWSDSWYPTKGDTLELSIGYDDVLVYCGSFVIDELQIKHPPATVTVKGLAAATNSPLRTKTSGAYERQTLRQIVEKIALANGLTVQGEIANIFIERVSKNRESDLSFLARIAKEYGYLFSVRDKRLTFTSIYAVEKTKAVMELARGSFISMSLEDKSIKTFKSATVKYRNPKTNKVVSATVKAGDILEGGTGTVGGANTNTSADVLELKETAENEQQARVKAQAALHRTNTNGQTGNFSLIGNPILLAGSNFLLTGVGKMSGTWHITRSTHTISRDSGYLTSLEAKRLQDVSSPEQRKTPLKKKRISKFKVKSTPPKSGGGGGGGVRELYSGTT